jgi:hypothetical protein
MRIALHLKFYMKYWLCFPYEKYPFPFGAAQENTTKALTLKLFFIGEMTY